MTDQLKFDSNIKQSKEDKTCILMCLSLHFIAAVTLNPSHQLSSIVNSLFCPATSVLVRRLHMDICHIGDGRKPCDMLREHQKSALPQRFECSTLIPVIIHLDGVGTGS